MSRNASAHANELHARWCEDLRRLADNVHIMHIRSEIFEGLDAELVRTQREGSGLLVEVLRPTYAEAQAVRVRLLVDNSKGTRSLTRLVGEMAQHSTVLNRERYVAPYEEHGSRDLADDDFDLLAGQGADHMPRRKLLAIRAQIEAAGEVVKRYVDERIAHAQRDTKVTLMFGQLKSAIHKLSGLYTTVGHILTSAHHEPVPIITDDWQGPFRDGLFPLADGADWR
jgi:hypothetical protein